jgi:hypothetical protein
VPSAGPCISELRKRAPEADAKLERL